MSSTREALKQVNGSGTAVLSCLIRTFSRFGQFCDFYHVRGQGFVF